VFLLKATCFGQDIENHHFKNRHLKAGKICSIQNIGELGIPVG
jgi:hypothetical protein